MWILTKAAASIGFSAAVITIFTKGNLRSPGIELKIDLSHGTLGETIDKLGSFSYGLSLFSSKIAIDQGSIILNPFPKHSPVANSGL